MRVPYHRTRSRRRPTSAVVEVSTAVCVILLTLAACAPTPDASTSLRSKPSSTPSPTTSPAGPPTLDRGGDAEQNKAFFDFVNENTIARMSSPGGREFVDGLVAAGFAESDMQLTADRTSINLPAPSIEFSVRLGDGCVVGQYGPDSTYRSLASPMLATGSCLIGQTRPINW